MKILLTLGALLLGYTLYALCFQTIHIAMARDQVKIFEIMREKALKATPQEAEKCANYIRQYYPSGTKQAPGTSLDQMVETARAAALREIAQQRRD